MMRRTIKRIFAPVLKRFFRIYLNRRTNYRHEGLDLMIEKGVFHPKYFFSTRIFIDFLKQQNLAGKRLLELGAGSGMIAFFASKKGALVTASDINKTAIEGLVKNAERNRLSIEIVESDLFSELDTHSFDVIVINPPYYPSDPQNMSECAWFCGKNFEYFKKLFFQLNERKEAAKIWMILSEDCEINQIQSLAADQGISFETVHVDQNWAEKNIICQLKTGNRSLEQ